MIVPNAIKQRYEFVVPYLDRIEQDVQQRIFKYCNDEGFAYQGRKKDVESVSEKLEGGRVNSWQELDDLYGCSIIVPSLADEARVLEFLRASFDEVQVRHRDSTSKPADAFRFDATRWIGKLRPPESTTSQPVTSSIRFEVQVRSAFEHAWSVALHGLSYKSEDSDWRRLRMAAQMKAAVEQLDQLILGFEEAKSRIVESDWPDTRTIRYIIQEFRKLEEAGLIPRVAVPGSWRRFGENVFALIRSSANCPRDHDGRFSYVQSCLARVADEVTTHAQADTFPLSISLLQLCFGVLWECKFVVPKLNNYTPLVTTELVDLYPEVDKCNVRITFD